MRGEGQRNPVKTYINIWMMLVFFGPLGDPAHKGDAPQKPLKLESAANGLRPLRPVRKGFQMKDDLFMGQGRHNSKMVFSPGAAFFAAAGKFVDGGPGAGFRIFYADTLLLVASFDVCRLTFLLVGVAGFIALRHKWFFLSGGTP